MTTIDERLQRAGDSLAQVGAVIDELEYGIALVQRAEGAARRTGRTLRIAGVVIACVAVVIGGTIVLRRLLGDHPSSPLPPRIPVDTAGEASTGRPSGSSHAQAAHNGD
jgi:hypothetical protein